MGKSNLNVRYGVIMILPWLIWGLSCSFYSYQFFMRVSICGLAPQLIKYFHVDALTLSNIAASFFYAYVIMQLPGGILIEKFGAHLMLVVSNLICSLGCFVFALSNQVIFVELSRVCIGFGAAFAGIIVFTLTRTWFNKRQFPLLNGLTLTIGTLGAVIGGVPLIRLGDIYGWRVIMYFAGGISIVLAVLSLFIVKNTPEKEKDPLIGWNQALKGFWAVIRTFKVWLAGFYYGCLFVPIATFAILWGPPFLISEYHVTNAVADFSVDLMFIGYGLGGPITGWFYNLFGRRLALIGGSLISLLLMLVVLYVPHIPFLCIYILLFLLGVFISCAWLAGVVIKELVPKDHGPIAFGFISIFSSAGSALILPLIGYILIKEWDGTVINHIDVYRLANFHIALAIIPFFIFLSFIIAFFIPDSCAPETPSIK